MNELRMYVEHLFEGKVLTADNIELKEEIYGNLVARFEDYVAQGLSESEALARTKESITSVDDVLSGATDASDEDGAQPQADEPAADLTEQLPCAAPAPAVEATQAAPAVAAVAPVAAAASAEQVPPQTTARKKWPIVVGAAAAVLVLCGAVAFGMGLTAANTTQPEPIDIQVVEDTPTTDSPQAETKEPEAQADDTAPANGGATADNQATRGNQIGEAAERIMPRLADADDRDPEDVREYEATMAFASEIESSPASIPQTYAGTDPASGSGLSEFVGALPMGANAQATSFANGTVSIEYASINHDVEGDAIDLALAYNVVAIMAAYPDTVDAIEITVHESDDHPKDVDAYRFERTMVESALARVSGNAIVTIDGSLLASEGTWNEVFNNISAERFFDDVTDYAELGD